METWLAVAQDPIVDRVELRIARYTFLPLNNGEPLHVMQYLPGQGYGKYRIVTTQRFVMESRVLLHVTKR
jgi:hypothetical protein